MYLHELHLEANSALFERKHDRAQVFATLAVADRLEALVNVMDSIGDRVSRIEHHLNEGLTR